MTSLKLTQNNQKTVTRFMVSFYCNNNLCNILLKHQKEITLHDVKEQGVNHTIYHILWFKRYGASEISQGIVGLADYGSVDIGRVPTESESPGHVSPNRKSIPGSASSLHWRRP